MRVMRTLATIKTENSTHPKTTKEVLVNEQFVRIEVGAAAVNRSGATVREAIRLHGIPAVRDGRTVLVDLAALRQLFTPQPIVPNVAKAK